MGFCTDPICCLSPRPPLAAANPLKAFKPATIFCCIKGPVDSTSRSASSTGSFLSSRWSNPLRPSESPEIVRHWIEAQTELLPTLSQALSNIELETSCLVLGFVKLAKNLAQLNVVFCILFPVERFTVVSYNILADKNASKHRDLYPNVPSIYMKWDRRKRVICKELMGWNPDIVCLQEVDKYFDISSTMREAGYLGSYKMRTGDAVDGCAMFWKADKFRLLDGESIEFKQFGLGDNVAQLSVFEVRSLLSRAHILSEKWGNIPVLLGGDYNSTPESALYEFLSSSTVIKSCLMCVVVFSLQLNIMLHNKKELSGQKNCRPSQVLGVNRESGNLLKWVDRSLNNCWTDEEIKVATGSTECLVVVHPLKLNSSYAMLKGSTRTRGSHGEPLATSYLSKFLGTVDYLWYSNGGLVPTRVLDTIPLDILQKTGGIPCKKLGSDHLALVSEYAFMQHAMGEQNQQ
ncbi:hypothetical protein RJ639_006141 [Escallonia herrerae]|uniref:Endonuclease/exonuclease/phosphatase domain-containing protein n=1 Tax=Escallonia herrerae TaxID=1293975 RepID=A0AA88VU15_9ASTE|nr:hypothetical protein RJ639_006141 [Escallonia herrerae]